MIDINNIYILNPDYHFKNDIDRIVMYSNKQVKYNASIEWIGYIHPFQAMILSLFTDNKTLTTHIDEIAKHFHLSPNAVYDMILPYINNSGYCFTVTDSNKVIFPKNTLIPLSQIEAEDMHYDFSISDLQCSNVDLTPDRMHRSPQSLLFMLTNKCVTNCKYCYADKKTKCIELDTEKILALIEEAKQLKMSYIDIIGGEVFCKKDWDIILHKLVDSGLTPSYISTKVPINVSIAEKLYKTGYNNVIQISLDILDEDKLIDLIECKKGYLKSIKDGIDILQKYGFKIQIDTILTKHNSNKSDITELYNYIKQIKNLVYWEVRVPKLSIYTPQTFSEIQATKKDLTEICSFIKSELIPDKGCTIYVSDEAIEEIYKKGKPNDQCFKGGSCGILENRLFVLPDGKVTLCEQLYWHPQFILGDLKEQTLAEIWQSPRAKALFEMGQTQFRENSACTKCHIFEFCRKNHRRCLVKVIKAYGEKNWDYPDPRCQYAPSIQTNLIYK